MKFTITQTDAFEVEAATAQEAYDLFIANVNEYFLACTDRTMQDENGDSQDWAE